MDIDKILDEAEKLQKEIHGIIAEVSETERGKNIPYADLRATILIMKISELKLIIEELKLKNDQA